MRNRFWLACLVPFLCLVSVTMIRNNIAYALDGMINHTAVDWPPPGQRKHFHGIDHVDTCVMVLNESDGCHGPTIQDGPFPWNNSIEALLNMIIAIGSLIGTLVTLIVYDYINMRFVFSLCLAYAGFLNIITPPIAKEGGYYSVLILRFFTGFYSAILNPAVPMIVQHWFLEKEQCRTNVLVWLGPRLGKMFFIASGYMIVSPGLGWEFLFYLPGCICILCGAIFFIVITDDPLDNLFLSYDEKKLIAEDKNWDFHPPTIQYKTKLKMRSQLRKYRRNIQIMKNRDSKIKTPWFKILTDPDFILATIQTTVQAWQSPVMTLMMKKYLLEIHGYSISNAALMVTAPPDISLMILGYLSAWAGDIALNLDVPAHIVRRAGAVICSLSSLPYLILPFLPCYIVSYKATVVGIQILGSFSSAGSLAGYTTFRELSPTFTRQLFGLASLVSNTVPYIMVPLFMGWFKTSTRHPGTLQSQIQVQIQIHGQVQIKVQISGGLRMS
ncbi:uncharacterized transporter slc-17.3 isoform X3 [Eurytemora carolleeae]|uniref:uncharacterized transporter slc-17.3 isoform X3 n=1 Tax=Eurytemora carolleeae TaxID=1294199 RepID=UPI000C78C2CF|nr:uncharacterized transporter slc-17.3 isoform X3 [Eurytemora carolleeae]|eukprot:XP_023334822.1 uncharacterized transporter slc-17.3-like isoform X3 [Eurytemora affinis]